MKLQHLTLAALSASLATAAFAAPQGPHTADVTAHFARNAWEPTLDGFVHAGGSLGIDYEAPRLPKCRTTNRNTAWSIEMHYQFDGGDVQSLIVQGAGMPSRIHDIDVPLDAQTLTVWFENYDLINAGQNGDADKPCRAWDSVFGENYTFTVEPPEQG